ncbi:MAG: thiamine ABC transporter substrate binding subunit [Enterobacteriaceae bacterium]
MFIRIVFSLLLSLLALPGFAQSVLTVYTYDSFASDWGAGPPLKKLFETECQCSVQFVALGDGVALLNRLKMEGKKTKADIVLGIDNNLLSRAQESKLFAASKVDTSHLTLPVTLHDSTFIPYDYGYFAFVYNREKLLNPPKSLHELIDSPQPWKIIYQDPRTSTPGLGLLLWIEKVYGSKAPEAWQKLAQKTVTVTKGWSEAYALFLKGEADMVLSYSTSPAYHRVEEKDDRYRAADFSEGHYLQIEYAARVASSKQPELAQQFLHFLLSEPAQQVIASKNWMYPVLASATPPAFAQLTKPAKALQFSPQEIQQQHNQWIKAWQQAVSQ